MNEQEKNRAIGYAVLRNLAFVDVGCVMLASISGMSLSYALISAIAVDFIVVGVTLMLQLIIELGK